jgi:aspartyl-tRNA(Asn)/glutamyl-tRNA(Gln) amidotransferase subunit B
MSKVDLNKFIESKGIKYYLVIGLEVHAEMKTKTKMWCSCKNEAASEFEKVEANKNICPVCMAYPGTLPVPNKQAIENLIKIGLAVGADISNFTEFDRKNYFYPDIPKGYQISQYKYPIISNGELAGVKLTRIHLEEDTARSTHDKDDATLVDFNRAGVPLMELVTEPVIFDKETAVNFAKELQLLLRYLDISEANMEQGQMRVEVNLSLTTDPEKFGTKVEVKNINSFKAVEKSIEFEIKRHINCLETGEKIVQETRGYDEATGTTKPQRSKENAEDYRYFPDPDISKLFLKDSGIFDFEKIKSELPELPSEKRKRLESFGVKKDYIELFITQPLWGDYFDKTLTQPSPKERAPELHILCSNYIASDLVGIFKARNFDTNTNEGVEKIKKALPNPALILELAKLIQEEKLSSRAAKDILQILIDNKISGNEKSVLEIATEKDMLQISDPEKLLPLILPILENPNSQKSIADYKAGKEVALMSLVGQVIKQTNGKANPTVTKNIFIEKLKI